MESKKEKSNYEKWSTAENNELLRLLVESANARGRNTDGSFTSNLLMTKILPVLNAKLNCKKTVGHVRSKLRVWKRQYQPIANLMASNSGFGWDHMTQQITAPDEVWEEYFKHHPEARDYRKERIEDFDDLKIVVGNSYATGQNSYGMGVGVTPPIVDLQENSMNEFIDLYNNLEHIVGDDVPSSYSPTEPYVPLVGIDDDGSENVTPSPTNKSLDAQHKRKSVHVTPPNRKAKVVNNTNRLINSVEAIAENIKAIREICERPSETIDVWKILVETPGLDRKLRFEAADMLDNPAIENKFVRMDPETRRDWILHRLQRDG